MKEKEERKEKGGRSRERKAEYRGESSKRKCDRTEAGFQGMGPVGFTQGPLLRMALDLV